MGTPETAAQTLARANQATINTLGPAPPLDPNAEGLRWRIMNILYSDPCGKICFTLDNLYLAGFKYRYVAELLGRSKIRIEFDSNLRTKGVNAEYDPSDKLVFPPGFSLEGPQNDSKRETVVHECTHACFDATAPGPTISSLSNEAAAFIAGCVYLINAGRPYPKDNNDFTQSVFSIATKIVEDGRKGSSVPKADPNGVAYIKSMLSNTYKNGKSAVNGIPYK